MGDNFFITYRRDELRKSQTEARDRAVSNLKPPPWIAPKKAQDVELSYNLESALIYPLPA